MQATRSLPWCKGPKLAPFKFKDDACRSISFLEHLGRGLHADVFRAAIDGQVFAVKVFRFVHFTELASATDFRLGRLNIEDVINHKDPFHCECRAYGRLKETGREDLAARCYGYVLLEPEQEAELARIGFTDWDRRPAVKNQAIRAIVKEYIPDDGAPFTFEMLPQMMRDLRALGRLGIVNWDIRDENYRRGLLIDFSQAHTVPHMELYWNSDIFDRNHVMETCVRDQACFDDMTLLWNMAHPDRIFWPRFLPNHLYIRRLRSAPTSFASYNLYAAEGADFSAAFYDWEKKSSKRQEKSGRRTRRPPDTDKSQRTRRSNRVQKAAVRRPN